MVTAKYERQRVIAIVVTVMVNCQKEQLAVSDDYGDDRR